MSGEVFQNFFLCDETTPTSSSTHKTAFVSVKLIYMFQVM